MSVFTALGLLVLGLGACAPTATPGATRPTFDPVRAFAGRSHGDGTLSVIFQAPQPYHVESRGFSQPDGSFCLEQTVKFAGKPPQQRHWLLREVSPEDYTGTLSDAEGSVKGRTVGPQFRLMYALPGGLTMHQTLTLEPGGKTIDNIGRITFLGIEIGYLHETIERRRVLKQTAQSNVDSSALMSTALAKPLRRE